MMSLLESHIEVHRSTKYPLRAWEQSFQKICTVQKVTPLPLDTPVQPDKIRFVCTSDTHGQHSRIKFPPGDVFLHAGDFTMKGYPCEVAEFNEFLGTLPHPHKVVIAGNHEPTFDPKCIQRKERVAISLGKLVDYGVDDIRELLTNCTYLEDSGIELHGIKIYGSPWQPRWAGYGFNLSRGEKLLEKWNLIPSDTDILITHGPPLGYGDTVEGHGETPGKAGCVELLQTVKERVKPTFHIFGHLHNAYGSSTDGVTTFINAACCDNAYQPVDLPIIFDIPLPAGGTKAIQKQKEHSVEKQNELSNDKRIKAVVKRVELSLNIKTKEKKNKQNGHSLDPSKLHTWK